MVLNKTDQINHAQRREVLEFMRHSLPESVSLSVLFPFPSLINAMRNRTQKTIAAMHSKPIIA